MGGTGRIPVAALVLALVMVGVGFRGAAANTATPAEVGNWFLPPSLLQLQREVDSWWPGRSRASDGWIGDRSHRSGQSDHNPVGHRNGPDHGTRGAVHGLDITASGINTAVVLNGVIGDHRVAYVIYNTRIWSAWNGWTPRAFAGDPHHTHIHVSLRGDSGSAARAAEYDTGTWLSGSGRGNPTATGHGSGLGVGSSGGDRYTPGERGQHITEMQHRLIGWGFTIKSGATGVFGAETQRAVQQFQRAQGWQGGAADGIPGGPTLRRLGLV